MKNMQLLIKPVSSQCNMRCRYCFYRDEASRRRISSYGSMTEETLEMVVKKALETAEESCVFGFQGGEPTLAGIRFCEACVSFVNRYKKEQTKVYYSIQTNGLLLNQEWTAFLKEHQFLVGLSLDGSKSLHDHNRKDERGVGTFVRVLENGRMLMEAGVDVNVLCVLTHQSVRLIRKIYRELKAAGFYHQQYLPCMDPMGEGRGMHSWSLTPEDYYQVLCGLFDLWYEDYAWYLCREDKERHPKVYIRTFDNWLEMLLGGTPEACSQYGKCTMQNVVEADGSVYPCDFYALDEYCMGNIRTRGFEELMEDTHNVASPGGRFFVNASLRDSRCQSCKWYALCRGGCRRDCYCKTDAAYGVRMRNYYCETYQKFFEYAIGGFERLAAYRDRAENGVILPKI